MSSETPAYVVGLDLTLQRAGDWLARHQSVIRRGQWVVVAVYATLVAVPAFLTLPTSAAHVWTNLTLFAQFVFWGIWWPFVILSMALVGRLWCGLLCPEGTLTEAISAHGRGHAIPHWLKWKYWPFVAFACTTIYGQMVSVYQYPKPTLLILGGSTGAAMVVGFLYGRDKRIWCRYLCPVTGVFGVLSKLAPLHFRVDRQAWNAWHRPAETPVSRVNCAPLVPIRTMKGSSACHMCGRCSGFRGAITLARRSPNHEIVHIAGTQASPAETVLIIFGLLGLAAGAFLWSSSDVYVAIKQTLAAWLVNDGVMWPLQPLMPWWILTNYPDQNDVLTLLDGAVLVGYILAVALLVGSVVTASLLAATLVIDHWKTAHFHHFAQSLIPLAGCGVFLGLSSLTVTLLRNEGLDLNFVGPLRTALLVGAAGWCLWLGWQIAALYSQTTARRIAAMVPMTVAVAAGCSGWISLFWL